MENQEKLEKGVGDKEVEKLKASVVKIIGARIEYVEKAKSDKVIFIVKHPDQDDTIELSSAKIQIKDKLKVYGLWYKEDEDGKIQKGSTLAQVLGHLNAASVKDCEGKDMDTVEDDTGYLTLRAYK